MPTDCPRPRGRRRIGGTRAAQVDTQRVSDGRINGNQFALSDAEANARRRALVLESLRASPEPRSILSLAEELGVHANTVRFHLEPL